MVKIVITMCFFIKINVDNFHNIYAMIIIVIIIIIIIVTKIIMLNLQFKEYSP